MAAQFINRYRKNGKSDANDAEAIYEAVGRQNSVEGTTAADSGGRRKRATGAGSGDPRGAVAAKAGTQDLEIAGRGEIGEHLSGAYASRSRNSNRFRPLEGVSIASARRNDGNHRRYSGCKRHEARDRGPHKLRREALTESERTPGATTSAPDCNEHCGEHSRGH